MTMRIYEVAPRLLVSLGVALLLCSLLLVPTSQSLADDGGGGNPDLPCDAGCPTNYSACTTPYPGLCGLVGIGACPHPPPPPDCSGCACTWDGVLMKCWCQPSG